MKKMKKRTTMEVEITIRMTLPKGANTRDAVDYVRTSLERMESIGDGPMADLDPSTATVRITKKREVTEYV